MLGREVVELYAVHDGRLGLPMGSEGAGLTSTGEGGHDLGAEADIMGHEHTAAVPCRGDGWV